MLGCGEGRLQRLVKERGFERVIGLDASIRALERARERLKLDRAGGPSVERVRLLHGALTYRDARWADVDAVALVEVIEHLDADRLPTLVEIVFGAARPKTVIVTTPNITPCSTLCPPAPSAIPIIVSNGRARNFTIGRERSPKAMAIRSLFPA